MYFENREQNKNTLFSKILINNFLVFQEKDVILSDIKVLIKIINIHPYEKPFVYSKKSRDSSFFSIGGSWAYAMASV